MLVLTKPTVVLVDAVVVVTVLVALDEPPKTEPRETVAEAREERARGTTRTMPMLKNTNINKMAQIMRIRRNVFIT